MDLKVIQKIRPLLVETDDCIEYSIKDTSGYGHIQYLDNQGKKKHYRAHRASYEIFNQCTLATNDIILHKCDNPSCINPKHLIKGTHDDNVKDKVSKNRQAKGITNGRYLTGYYSKYNSVEKPKSSFNYNRSLTKEEVQQIKLALANRQGVSIKKLSLQLNIPYQTLRDINCGRTYKDI